jgi:hypothetical protein
VIAAVSAVHLSLVSLAFVAVPNPNNSKLNGTTNGYGSPSHFTKPVRYHSETDKMGNAKIGYSEVRDWDSHAVAAGQLVDKCEDLYQSFLKEDGRPPEIEKASERM